MKGLNIGVTMVYISEATASFLRDCEMAELRYAQGLSHKINKQLLGESHR